jgi:hypothetical protein
LLQFVALRVSQLPAVGAQVLRQLGLPGAIDFVGRDFLAVDLGRVGRTLNPTSTIQAPGGDTRAGAPARRT